MVARNVYPSVPAAREVGPSFFHEILPASDARSHEMTERQPDVVGTIGKVTGVHLFCSGIPNLGKAQLQHPFGKGGRLKEGEKRLAPSGNGLRQKLQDLPALVISQFGGGE